MTGNGGERTTLYYAGREMDHWNEINSNETNQQ